MVYVLNKDGQPLMPTKKYAWVRVALKNGKAIVKQTRPFTIQLTYDCLNHTQPIYLGIDPGRTNIGTTAVIEDGTSVYSASVETRNKDIPKLMQQRKAFRQAHRLHKRREKRRRRAVSNHTTSSETNEDGVFLRMLPQCKKPISCHDIKNKEAKFNNRKRPDGWLTPTANQLLQTHINLINKIEQILPITDIVLEINSFDFAKIDNPNIKAWEYGKGRLYGEDSLKSAVNNIQKGCCIFCEENINHYHHIVPKHLDGSNTIDNIVGLCSKHHYLVHTEDAWKYTLLTLKDGLNKKYNALSVINQIMPKLLNILSGKYPGHLYTTTGESTFTFRKEHFVDKTHYGDAYCIACSALQKVDNIHPPIEFYNIRQFRRHDRQCCHKAMLNRNYYYNGEKIASNRHKAIEQTCDSLEQYINKHSDICFSQLEVKHPLSQYKNRGRVMPGSVLKYNNSYGVLKGSSGTEQGKPSYYILINGQRVRANKCTQILHNGGLVYV